MVENLSRYRELDNEAKILAASNLPKFEPEDPEILARNATINLNLSLDENSEQAVVMHEKAKELKLPYAWVKQLDNKELNKPLSANNLHPKLQKYIAKNYDKVAMIRGQLPQADKVARRIAKIDGVPKFPTSFNSYKEYAQTMYPNKRQQQNFLGKVVELMKKENALLAQLNYEHPEGWSNLSDEEVRKRINLIGEQRNADFGDINISRLRRGGMDETDLMDMTDVLGARSMYQLATRMSPEELAAIDKNSPIADQLKAINYLRGQSLDLRGRSLGGKITHALANAVPYMAEFALTGGLATVGKLSARTAITSTLKEAGFTGLKEGAKALVTKEGAKGLAKAATMALTSEAKRLPAYLPKVAAQALNEWESGPVYYLNNGVRHELPEQKLTQLGNLLANKILSTYFSNVSEQVGEFLPSIDMGKLIPKTWRNKLVQRFLNDLSNDSLKFSQFKGAFAESIPFQGVYQEIIEEYVDNGFQRLSTIGSELTGLKFLDMQRDNFLGDWEEGVTIGATSLLLSAGGKAVHLPQAVNNYYRAMDFVDNHRALVNELGEMPLSQQSPNMTQDYIESVRGGDMELELDPEDVETLYQKAPQFVESLGLTESIIQEAKANGTLLQVSQNRLALEQSKSPKNMEAGEEILQSVRATGRRIKEIIANNPKEEIAREIKEERERINHFTSKIYSSAVIAAEKAGISKSSVQSFATMAAFIANTLDKHTTDEHLVDNAIDHLVWEFVESPQKFEPKKVINHKSKVESGEVQAVASSPKVEETKGETVPDEYTRRFGNVLNTDNAKLLHEGYNPHNEKSVVEYHKKASEQIGKLFKTHVENLQNGDIVVFTGGGNGSGKSSVAGLFKQSKFVMDSTMTNFEATRKGIQSVLDKGGIPVLAFVYRSPIKAWFDGVLKRNQSKEGHIVPLNTFANTHSTAKDNFIKLAEEFGDKVKLVIKDNDTKKEITLDDLKNNPSYTKEQILEEINNGQNGTATERVEQGNRRKAERADNSRPEREDSQQETSGQDRPVQSESVPGRDREVTPAGVETPKQAEDTKVEDKPLDIQGEITEAQEDELLPEEKKMRELNKILETLPPELLSEWYEDIQNAAEAVVRNYSVYNIDISDALNVGFRALAYVNSYWKKKVAAGEVNPNDKDRFERLIRKSISNKFRSFTASFNTQKAKAKNATVSLDAQVGEDGDAFYDVISDESAPTAEDIADKSSRLDRFAQWGESLKADKQRAFLAAATKVLAEGKSFKNGELNLTAVAREMGITRKQAETLFKNIREQARKSGLKDQLYQTLGFLSDIAQGSFTPEADFAQSFNATIKLFKKGANSSTLIHEFAHWTRRMLADLVEGGYADDRLKNDLAAIDHYLDRQNYQAEWGTTEYFVEREEKFARSFEEYVRTGQSPNSFVATAFRTLKRMLMSIYKVALSTLHDFQLDDEIKGVFDSWFATEETVRRDSPIDQALSIIKGDFAGLLGLTLGETRGFTDLINQAKAQMEEATERRKRVLLPKLKTQWAQQAEDIMSGMKEYQGFNEIISAGGLNPALVEATIGMPGKKALRTLGALSKGDTHANVVAIAEKLGYSSIEPLLLELSTIQHPKAFTKQYVDEQIQKFQQDLNMDEKALSTQATLAFLENLAETLRGKTTLTRVVRTQELKNYANKVVSAMSVSQIQSKKNINNLKTLTGKLATAIGKKDFVKALEYTENLRRAVVVLRRISDAKTEIDRCTKFIKNSNKRKKGFIFGDHQEAIRELAYYFTLSQKEPGAKDKNFRRIVSGISAEDTETFGEQPAWSDFVFTEEKIAFKVLTVAEVEELSDFAKFVYGNGRNMVLDAKGSFASRVKEHVDDCLGILNTQEAKYHDRGGEKNRFAKGAVNLLHWGKNLRYLLGRADNFVHVDPKGFVGPNLQLREILTGGVSRFERLETRVREKATALVQTMLDGKPLRRLPRVAFTGKGLLHGYSKWNDQMVLAACLNMGNEVNRRRLMEGYGWSETDLEEIAKCITKKDWECIQGIWDLLSGELQQEVSKTFLEENHYRLRLVEATPFSCETAEGETLELNGGYYPIKYVYRTHGKDIAFGVQQPRLHADVSSTHERAKTLVNPDPVSLSLNVLASHIHENALYACTRMGCREVLGVIRSEAYKTAFGATQGFEAYDLVLALVKNVANPQPATEGVLSNVEGWFRTMMCAKALMGNLKTVGMQFASLTVGLNELGGHYLESIATFARDPKEFMTMVQQKSAFMKNRGENFEVDLKGSIDKLDRDLLDKGRAYFAAGAYFLMKTADKLVAGLGWYGKYRQVCQELIEEGIPLEEVEDTAVSRADDFVARTQGSARTTDLIPAKLEKTGRLLTPFITASGAQYNVQAEILGAIRNGNLKGAEALMAVCFNTLIPAIIGATVTGVTVGALSSDDDKNQYAWKRALHEFLSAPFSGMPIFRDLANSFFALAIDKTVEGRKLYFGDPLDAGAISAASQVFESLFKGGNKALENEWGEALWLWSEAVADAAHMPAVTIYKRAKKLLIALDVIEDEESRR